MSKKDQLLDAAEVRVRQGGYNNFSFREIADEIGIKSSSVHYHFPTKADMAAALAARYTQNFLDALGSVESLIQQGKDPLQIYIAQFRRALTEDKLMCLCGLLGAEAAMLPESVMKKTKEFFELNLSWLRTSYKLSQNLSDDDAQQAAVRMLATLEGAIIVGQIMQDESLFDLATKNY